MTTTDPYFRHVTIKIGKGELTLPLNKNKLDNFCNYFVVSWPAITPDCTDCGCNDYNFNGGMTLGGCGVKCKRCGSSYGVPCNSKGDETLHMKTY